MNFRDEEIQEGLELYSQKEIEPVELQKHHHGIAIPGAWQPRCGVCGNPMALNIMYLNDDCKAFWHCLAFDSGCTSDFEQVSFDDWYDTLPPGEIKQHFATVGISYSKLQEESLLSEGYIKVGGHNWGSSTTWGKLEGKKAWTGYRGQSLEYWEKK